MAYKTYRRRRTTRRPRRFTRRRRTVPTMKRRSRGFSKGVVNVAMMKRVARRASGMTVRNKLNRFGHTGTVQPNTYFAVLPFFHRSALLLSLSSGPVVTSYRANSLFDPTVASGGGQPRGFDQLATLYKRYQVYALVVEADFFFNTVNQNEWIRCFIGGRSSTDGTVWFTPGDVEEHTAGNIILGYMHSQKLTCKLRKYFRVQDLLNVPKKHYQTDSEYYSSTFLENPGIVPFVDVGAYTADATIAHDIKVNVNISYFVRCSEPITLAAST